MTKPRRVFQQLFLFWQEVEKTPVLLSIYWIFLSIKGQKAFSPESHSERQRGAVFFTPTIKIGSRRTFIPSINRNWAKRRNIHVFFSSCSLFQLQATSPIVRLCLNTLSHRDSDLDYSVVFVLFFI